MRIKLLEDYQGRKAGREWDCPWAVLGGKLIAAGKALAVEPCDLHLNPPAVSAAEPESDADGDDQGEGKQPPKRKKK